MARKKSTTVTHWGHYNIETERGLVKSVEGNSDDLNPSPISQSLLDIKSKKTRIGYPMVRKGYLEKEFHSDQGRRGKEPFVRVTWETAIALAAEAIKKIKDDYGNEAFYCGSYGWASPGKFHHAQSHLKRFFSLYGGFTKSEKTYSAAAAETIIPHVLGTSLHTLNLQTTPWEDIINNAELVVCFGGIPEKNLQVTMSGNRKHVSDVDFLSASTRGVKFVNISPIKGDANESLNAKWLPIKPQTDVALILALCTTLLRAQIYDVEFLKKYTVGFDVFSRYLLGDVDGILKDAKWAETITSLPAPEIEELAKVMASCKTFRSTCTLVPSREETFAI